MTEFRRDAARSWHTWRHFNPSAADDAEAAGTALYERGYRDAIADLAVFSEMLPLLRRLTELLEELSVEREAVRMTTDEATVPSVYWSSDADNQEALPF